MPTFSAEVVSLEHAHGRTLRQAVLAERDQPPFDRVTMDGIAVKHSSLAGGERRFKIEGTQHAGDPMQVLDHAASCIEIMTGAVLPAGSDCIIPVENIEVREDTAVVSPDYEGKLRQFVHPKGSDHREGKEVLSAGHTISAMDIAIIASCGLRSVEVNRLPRISVISTGNELVPAGTAIDAHQIRLSNGPALVAMLMQQGFTDTSAEHLLDEPAQLRSRLQKILQESNVLILSGGVSMGKADFVPQVLADLGVKVVFHKISQRPGKPMWFGVGPEQQIVFALPGNPVSTLVCCRQYVLPALFQASGRKSPSAETAVLTEDVIFKPSLTCFMPVRLNSARDGRLLAAPVATNTSGDFTALSGTDGYIELPRTESEFPAGTFVPLHRWANP